VRMVDINKALLMAVRTGKVTFGYKQTLEMMRGGKAKLVVLASNCPEKVRAEVNLLSRLNSIPVFQYQSSSIDLGVVCGRSYTVTAMALTELAGLDALKGLVEGANVK